MVFQNALQSAALAESRNYLKVLFATRYSNSGFKLPRVIYSDECCIDRVLLVQIFKELKEDGHDFNVIDEGPVSDVTNVFELPPGVSAHCIDASKESPRVPGAVHKLRAEAHANGGVIGGDIEWDISRAGAPCNSPATVQLAAGKFVVLFHVLHGQRKPPEKLPSSLVGILEDASLIKTSVGVKGDCTRLRNSYGVEVRNVVDLPAFAISRKVDLGLRRGLADLCLHLLGQRLGKEKHLRILKWNQASLSEEQKGCYFFFLCRIEASTHTAYLGPS